MILAEPEIWTRHQRAVIDGAIGWTSVRVLGLAGTAHGHFVQRTAFIHHRVLFRTDNCFCTGCCGYKFRYVSVGKREDHHGKWTEIRFARGRILNGIAEIFISNRNPYRFGRAKSVLHVVFLEIIYSMRCLTWHLFFSYLPGRDALRLFLFRYYSCFFWPIERRGRVDGRKRRISEDNSGYLNEVRQFWSRNGKKLNMNYPN